MVIPFHIAHILRNSEFIAEFWRIRALIARTAEGARAGGFRRGETQHDVHTLHVSLWSVEPLLTIFTETLALHSIQMRRQQRPHCTLRSFSLMSCRWAPPPC